MMETNPHACGVDDIVCPSLLPPHHACGVDDGGLRHFPPFSEWVTLAERY
jgi:hypothetical protein